MSTQKRESWWVPAAKVSRLDLQRCRQRQRSADRAGAGSPSARFVCAAADRVTAPLWSTLASIWAYHPSNMDLLLGALAWAATTFLRADQLPGNSVRPIFVAELSGSPPTPACRSAARRLAAYGTPASPRSSLPPVPFPSGLARLHRDLPQAPAAYRRRAERYDGQRDLYFLHAA